MQGIKNILFGIALIILGFYSLYVSNIGGWNIGEIIGLILPVVGIVFAIVGLLDKSE